MMHRNLFARNISIGSVVGEILGATTRARSQYLAELRQCRFLSNFLFERFDDLVQILCCQHEAVVAKFIDY